MLLIIVHCVQFFTKKAADHTLKYSRCEIMYHQYLFLLNLKRNQLGNKSVINPCHIVYFYFNTEFTQNAYLCEHNN